MYPDYNWLPWRFERVPRHFWEDKKNQRNFLDWFAIQSNVGLYCVSIEKII